MKSSLKDFRSVVCNHHRFRYRGGSSKSHCFTVGKDYTITHVESCEKVIHTLDDLNHKHNLSLKFFNENCQLIDLPVEILELMDDLDDALICKDIEKFTSLCGKITAGLEEIILIKEKDVQEGQYYESKTQRVRVVRFKNEWMLIRSPKIGSFQTFMFEHYLTKTDLVKKLNEKKYSLCE